MSDISTPIRQPFRFDFVLRYFLRSPDEILDVVRDGRHYRVLDGEAGLALIETETNGYADEMTLVARLLAGRHDPEILSCSLVTLYQSDLVRDGAAWSEPLAAALVRHFGGLPVVQAPTAWEALAWAIIGQQINIAFAYRLKRRFVEEFGERLDHLDVTYHAFPSPERVARLEHERDLRPLQFSRQKSRYLIELARAICTDALDFDEIAQLDDEAASSALQRQLGVGRWTAEYALLRGFGRRDVIPAGDAALKFAIGKHLGLGRHASEEEVRELATRWRPLRGEIAFLLWFAMHSGWFRD